MINIFGISLILATAVIAQGYRKFGLNCEDIECISGKKCIIARVPCENPNQREGEQCGTYPECKTDQLASDFSIDTTLTIANTRNSIIIPNTITNRNRTYRDNDFELLTDSSNPDKFASHAGQRLTNVLVIVQDGSQQPQRQNPWLNRGQSPPCAVSPVYPYSCNYPGNIPNPGSGIPSYPQARSANGPQLVPPTPPCYYNCYPRVRSSPYARHRFRRTPQMSYQPVGMPAPMPPGYPPPRPFPMEKPRQSFPQYMIQSQPQTNPQYPAQYQANSQNAMQGQLNPQLYFSVGMSYPPYMNYNGRYPGAPPSSFYSPYLTNYTTYYYNVNLPFLGGSS